MSRLQPTVGDRCLRPDGLDACGDRRGALLRRQRHVDRGCCLVARTVACSTSQIMLSTSRQLQRVDRSSRDRDTTSSSSSINFAPGRCAAVPRLAQHGRLASRPCRVTTDVEREHRVLLRRLVGALEALHPARAAARRVGQIVARSRIRAASPARHDRRQRIGALVGREPHHAEHDDDADGRGGGRRRGRRRQVHVVEHHAHAREERRIRSAFSRLTTVAVKTAASSLRRAPRGPARARRSAVRPTRSSAERRGAALAPFEVRADRDLIGERRARDRETPAAAGASPRR